MKSMTATNLRKNLFRVLAQTTQSIPMRIRYKKQDVVMIPYTQYLRLKDRKRPKAAGKKLRPLIAGKILKPLGAKADAELMRYLGL